MTELDSVSGKIRVLHSVSTYLNPSENWIYPQIVSVPHTESSVLCKKIANFERFPLKKGTLITEHSDGKKISFRRFFDAAARRIGWKNARVALSLKVRRPHILHAHFGPRGWESLALKEKLGIPLVTSFYGYDAWQLPMFDSIWLDRYAKLFDKGDTFVVEGPAMRERLVELGCPEKKIIIQRIGVDLAALPFEAKDFSRGLRIAMAGRFVEKKGLEDGLKACALARTHGVDLQVTIFGDGTDAAGLQIKDELNSIANTAELVGRVTFAGFLPLSEMQSRFKAHNIFLCPSRHAANGDAEGGSPVVLTEAMALGLFCIGTRHCDIPELILDGETGYLCKEKDIEGIAENIIRIALKTDECEKISSRGRNRVMNQFCLSTQMAQARNLYGGVIRSAHNRRHSTKLLRMALADQPLKELKPINNGESPD